MDEAKKAKMINYAVAAGMLFAAYKFGPGMAKAAAVAVASVIVAKQLPYVKDVM